MMEAEAMADRAGRLPSLPSAPRRQKLKRSSSGVDEEFVVVTVEEVELSLSSVVALPDEDEEDECRDERLEARVKATQQVASVHEIALLERAAAARALARQLSGAVDEPNEDDTADALRRATLDAQLRKASIVSQRFDPATQGWPQFQDCDEVLAALPLKLRVSCTELATAASSRDASEHQARRDIERDSLVVDNDKMEGRLGYDFVVLKLARAQKRLVGRADATEWRSVDADEFAGLAKLLLRAVNRTESGGLALEALQRLLQHTLTPVPDSKNAEPLGVQLRLGPANIHGLWRWGLLALVQGSTNYRLYAGDDFDHVVAHARATFSNYLVLPLDALDRGAKAHPPQVYYDPANALVDLELHSDAQPRAKARRVDDLDAQAYAVVD